MSCFPKIFYECLPRNRVESARQAHEDQPLRQHPSSNNSTTGHEHLIRRNHSEVSERENDISYRARPRPRTHHYAVERPQEQEVSRPRPRSFYENPTIGRDFRDQRNVVDPREVRITDLLSHAALRAFFRPARLLRFSAVSLEILTVEKIIRRVPETRRAIFKQFRYCHVS